MSTCINFAGRALFCFVATALVCAAGSRSARGQFVEFNDETETRIEAPNDLVVGDTQEKDYAWPSQAAGAT